MLSLALNCSGAVGARLDVLSQFVAFIFCTAGEEDLTFTAEPQDTVVSKNASVVIDCGVPAGWLRRSDGPAPLIEWKRDGVLLSLNGETRRYYPILQLDYITD